LVRLLRLLPAGKQFETLYESIGIQLGMMAFDHMNEQQKQQLSFFLHIPDGKALGIKIGKCFADDGWFVTNKNDFIFSIASPIVRQKAGEITAPKVEAMIRKAQLDKKIRESTGRNYS